MITVWLQKHISVNREEITMNKFERVEIEVLDFEVKDVITTSGAFTGGNPYEENELPIVPFSTEIKDQF